MLEPWLRETGFIICYGAIVLKLYRHLVEFRTRKAHRYVVRDLDLLRYLCAMIVAVLCYLAAFTALCIDYLDYSELIWNVEMESITTSNMCKPLKWDYVSCSIAVLHIYQTFCWLVTISLTQLSANRLPKLARCWYWPSAFNWHTPAEMLTHSLGWVCCPPEATRPSVITSDARTFFILPARVTGATISGRIDSLRVRRFVRLLHNTRLVLVGPESNNVIPSALHTIATHQHHHYASHIPAEDLLST